MNTLAAINLAASLMQTAMNAMTAAGQVSGMIHKAQTEGRDLTPEEMAAVQAIDDSAREGLIAAIDKAT